jgi:hypothetical protein
MIAPYPGETFCRDKGNGEACCWFHQGRTQCGVERLRCRNGLRNSETMPHELLSIGQIPTL